MNDMNPTSIGAKVHSVLLSLLGAAGVVAIVWWGVQMVMNRSGGVVTERTYGAVINYDRLPKSMPRFFLLGDAPTILHGVEDQLNGQISSDVQYATPTALGALYEDYLGYFTQSGWTIQNEFKSPDLAVLVARRYRDSLTISMEPKDGVTDVVVSLVKESAK